MAPTGAPNSRRKGLLQGGRRLLMFLGGSAMIYHEVWVTDTSETVLVVLGLWLVGAPIAEFLDRVRQFATPPSAEELEGSQDRRQRKRV